MNGMNELKEPARLVLFDCMKQQPVDWADVRRKTEHKLCPEAIAFLRHVQNKLNPDVCAENPVQCDLVAVGHGEPSGEQSSRDATGMTTTQNAIQNCLARSSSIPQSENKTRGD